MSSNLEVLAGQVCRLTDALGSKGAEEVWERAGASQPPPAAAVPALPCLLHTTASQVMSLVLMIIAWLFLAGILIFYVRASLAEDQHLKWGIIS
jgi:hypothetical protein